MTKGGRYINNGQYDHHVWLWHILRELQLDIICYGSSFVMYNLDGSFERIAPEDVVIKHG